MSYLSTLRTSAVRTTRATTPNLRSSTRSLTSSASRRADGRQGSGNPNSKHLLDKSHTLDPQAKAKADAQRSGGADAGGNAVQRKDHTEAAKKAKGEHPAAPDTIGMQDERGGKGV